MLKTYILGLKSFIFELISHYNPFFGVLYHFKEIISILNNKDKKWTKVDILWIIIHILGLFNSIYAILSCYSLLIVIFI